MENETLTPGQIKARNEFIEKYPFQFNLLRLTSNGQLTHVNSLYKGYNCTDMDLTECNGNSRKRVICNTQEEIDTLLSNPGLIGRQHLHILTPISHPTQRPEND